MIMKLASMLTTDQVVLDMRSEEHLPAVEELLDHLVAVGMLPGALRDEIADALKRREEQVSTGIGYGVAIPHTFSDKIDKVVTVFGRSAKGIDFEALDHGPVHFVVLFVVPKRDYHLHLQTLAAIAKMFTNCEIRRQLAAATSRAEILDILAGKASGNAA